MTIFLQKFGAVLSSRQSGSEARNAFQPTLNTLDETEDIVIDFSGVSTFTPSWGDEFLTPLLERFGDRLVLLPSENLSVQMTIETLEEVHGKRFIIQNA